MVPGKGPTFKSDWNVNIGILLWSSDSWEDLGWPDVQFSRSEVFPRIDSILVMKLRQS